jgi:hypothetical protein
MSKQPVDYISSGDKLMVLNGIISIYLDYQRCFGLLHGLLMLVADNSVIILVYCGFWRRFAAISGAFNQPLPAVTPVIALTAAFLQ